MSLTSISFEEHDVIDGPVSDEEVEQYIQAGIRQHELEAKEYAELPWWKKIFKKEK